MSTFKINYIITGCCSHFSIHTVFAVSLVASSEHAGLLPVLYSCRHSVLCAALRHTSACPKTGGLPATHAPTACAGLFPHIARDFARTSAGGDVSRCQTRSADSVAFTSCRSVDAEYWR